MNVTRILLGGLLAGVVINVSEGILNAVILMDDYQAMLETYNLTEASWAMTAYILTGFVIGFVLAWGYAAMRPRYGAGPKTAVMAGLATWVLAYAVPTVWFVAMGLSPGSGALTLAVSWGLVELVIAAMLAGWIYKEGDGGPVASEAVEGTA